MDLEEDIPENHLVRGRDSYHPKMLTQVIIYAYTQRIYSSRQIAKAVREIISFMWLAGRQRPKERRTKAAGNREVVVSLERLRYQNQAREWLRSEEGYALAVRRMTEPESVFWTTKE